MSPLVNEKEEVNQLVEELSNLGWHDHEECKISRSTNEFIEWSIFERVFKQINGLDKLEQEKLNELLNIVKDRLRKADTIQILDYLKYGIPRSELVGNFELDRDHLILIDFNNVSKNEFCIGREIEFAGYPHNSRPDIILYVNGIPIVTIEAKASTGTNSNILEEALNQLDRYEEQTPDLFKYVQIAVAYIGKEDSEYRPALPNNKRIDRFIPSYKWRTEDERCNILDLLRPERLLSIIKWYTFFMSKDKKIIARHVQYFAAEKAINRIKEYVEGISQKNKGLIWHWQGSGKTYTMIYIAYRFFQEYFRNDPIIFFMVDRIELQRQLYEEFIKNLEIKNFKEHIKLVSSIEELKNILKEIADNEKNKKVVKRGIYIVTIQKFRPEDLKDLEIRKKEILLLIDEAHRSQYGILAATMNKVLPNAIKIAFTGTPVFKKFERNTFSWFEYPEEKELYLHKYFINDSIGDGFTVPIIYKVVTEKDININVREEDIKELINMWLKNVNEVSSLDDYIDEENITVTKNEIKEKLDNIKVFLENPRRLEKLAEYIAETVKENTEGFKFKAMVVTASRLACVRLWNYLVHELEKRYGSDAKKWVEVVMTYTNNDPKEIMEFKQDLLKRWKGYGNTDEINVEIQDRFKREENPKILIVTDMLITGFDCPKLKVMYLDKPLYDHKLLQTIARVNRPYKDNETEKEYGVIIDSVGLLEHVKNTVLTYENIGDKEISDDIRKMMRKSDDIFSEFKNTLSKLKKVLKEGIEVNSLKISIDIDQLKEKTHYKNFIKYLQEDINPKLEILSFNIYKPEVYEKILEPMKRVISLYDNLGADPRKVNYRNEYEIIAYMYNFIRLKAYGDMPKSLSEGLWKNVLNEIYDKTSVKGFGEKTEIKIVGEKLERLGENPREYFKSLEGQRIAAEAFFSIRDLIKQDLANPAYKHIAERLKELQEKWNSRGDPSLLKEIMSIYEETMSYREKTKGLSPQEKIITDIKQTIYQKYKKEVKLSSFSEALKSGDVQKVEDFDKLKNELWTSLFKDLAKELKDVPRGEKKKLVDELIDYVVKVLRDAKKNA